MFLDSRFCVDIRSGSSSHFMGFPATLTSMIDDRSRAVLWSLELASFGTINNVHGQCGYHVDLENEKDERGGGGVEHHL